MSELRLDLMVNGKKKTFIQDRVPLRKAIARIPFDKSS